MYIDKFEKAAEKRDYVYNTASTDELLEICNHPASSVRMMALQREDLPEEGYLLLFKNENRYKQEILIFQKAASRGKEDVIYNYLFSEKENFHGYYYGTLERIFRAKHPEKEFAQDNNDIEYTDEYLLNCIFKEGAMNVSYEAIKHMHGGIARLFIEDLCDRRYSEEMLERLKVLFQNDDTERALSRFFYCFKQHVIKMYNRGDDKYSLDEWDMDFLFVMLYAKCSANVGMPDKLADLFLSDKNHTFSVRSAKIEYSPIYTFMIALLENPALSSDRFDRLVSFGTYEQHFLLRWLVDIAFTKGNFDENYPKLMADNKCFYLVLFKEAKEKYHKVTVVELREKIYKLNSKYAKKMDEIFSIIDEA